MRCVKNQGRIKMCIASRELSEHRSKMPNLMELTKDLRETACDANTGQSKWQACTRISNTDSSKKQEYCQIMEERKKTVGWQTWPNGKSIRYVYKGLSSVPSIRARWLTTTWNSSSRGSNDLSGLQGHVCMCVCTHAIWRGRHLYFSALPVTEKACKVEALELPCLLQIYSYFNGCISVY